MSIVKHAIICAAGMGTRLGLNMPKCLVEINGKKIIEHQLELLKDVENIRIVVGFMEQEVIECVRLIRNDVVFVRNPNYKTTSNSHSLALGAKGIKDRYLFIDGDLIINAQDFKEFISNKVKGNLIGLTRPKTEEAVFATVVNNFVTSFSIKNETEYEWAGIAILENLLIDVNKGFVFKQFIELLPLPYQLLRTFEIDTPLDLEFVLNHIDREGEFEWTMK